jgi:trimeric autotransporter adhesin
MNMKRHSFTAIIFVITLYFAVSTTTAFSQTTEFSYQGFITDNNAPGNGNYDLEFKLFDAATGGTLIGTLQRQNVTVTNGIFGVVLDFGAFPPTNRFLEIGVRPPGGSVITTLAPRVKLLSTPYATQARNAENAANAANAVNAQTAQNAQTAVNAQTAQNALQLGGTPASQFVLGNDPRLNDSRNPLPGNANYIQNTTTPQGTSNFNVSGNGTTGGTLTGNVVSAVSHFNIGNARVLARPGSFNFFAGGLAGASNTTGTGNAFFGENAGVFNTTGASNTFVGFEAGRNNNIGVNNSYFGKDAGRNNNTGNDNAFFGNDAGQTNTIGGDNSFFGKGSGRDNTTGSDNAFFGSDAGLANTTESGNSFFGARSGTSNTTGSENAFFGFEAGRLNSDGNNNSFFGYEAGESNIDGVQNSYFGYQAGKLATAGSNSFFGYLSGTSVTTGLQNTYLGTRTGVLTTTGSSNTFVGTFTGERTTSGNYNVFLGLLAGNSNTTGGENTLIGTLTDVGSPNLVNATAIGANAFVTASNSLILGSINGVNGGSDTFVGIGTTDPDSRLHVAGFIQVDILDIGGATAVCRNASNRLSTCSSSLRYKSNIKQFSSGLELVNRLRPISFDWKNGGMRDLGLGAEDVAAVEPLLVTYNDKGEVEGVKYDRVAVVLLNAVKEQQEQIDEQSKQLAAQQARDERQQVEIARLVQELRRLSNQVKRSNKQ